MPTTIITSYTGQSLHSMGCLFGYYQSSCSYYIGNPISFFSLGEAVGAFGLIFAVYQLKNPSWDIVLKIREKWQSNLFWYLGIAGLVSIGLSALVTQIPFAWLIHPFDIPLFYEFAGFLFFIAAPSSLFILGRKRAGLFTEKRAERFYSILLGEIARPNAEGIEACINIIGSNLFEITKAVSSVPRRMTSNATENDEEHIPTQEELFAGYADAILTVILSDERVARYIATGRLDFLLHLVYCLKENNISESQTRLGVERIFEALFKERRSHLYNQLDFRGLTLSTNIFDVIFADPYMMTRFSPFNGGIGWDSFSSKDETYINVYLKALEHAVRGFWKNKCEYGMVNEINKAFRQLNDYCQWLSISARDKSKRNESMRRLSTIGMFLGHTYVWVYRDALEKNLISDYEKASTKTDSYSQSVNAAYAECLYHYLEALSSITAENGDAEDAIRLHAITSTTELIGVTCHPNDDLESIRKVLINLIWEKISGDMMSNEQGYYPMVLRVYISLVGLKVGQDDTVAALERVRLIDFLNNKIKPKILSSELMKDNKTPFEKVALPSNVALNRTTGKFEYMMSGGVVQVME